MSLSYRSTRSRTRNLTSEAEYGYSIGRLCLGEEANNLRGRPGLPKLIKAMARHVFDKVSAGV